MNIKIFTHSKLVQAVNARDLYEFLEIKQDFSGWIKNQIERARLVENKDFLTLTKKVARQILIEYFITVESAKNIGMLSQTDKGFEVRAYFLECERIALAKEAATPHLDAMRKLLLLDSPSEWVKRFPDEFYIAIMKLHHQDFDGNKSTPSYCANITRRWVYNVIIPSQLMDEIDEKKKSEKIHQWLSTDDGQQRLSQQIGKVTMIAMMCGSRSEFDLKCGIMFLGTPLQLTVFK